jgi:hypothetical protein
MRSFLIAAAAAASLAGFAVSSSPAAAWDYPYCLRGDQSGYPGSCNFVSYGQCQATASGTNSYCDVNPSFAYRAAEPYLERHYHARAQWRN